MALNVDEVLELAYIKFEEKNMIKHWSYLSLYIMLDMKKSNFAKFI